MNARRQYAVPDLCGGPPRHARNKSTPLSEGLQAHPSRLVHRQQDRKTSPRLHVPASTRTGQFGTVAEPIPCHTLYDPSRMSVDSEFCLMSRESQLVTRPPSKRGEENEDEDMDGDHPGEIAPILA